MSARVALMLVMQVLVAGRATAADAPATHAVAVFAGGCFWSMEKAFQETPGVIAAVSGYSGGLEINPTYEAVSSGTTGHVESVRVVYDPRRLTYDALLDVYWHNIDPTDKRGQFCDKGSPYKSVIFYGTAAEKAAAEASKSALEKSGVLKAPVATAIRPLRNFYPAEAYHQDFYLTHAERYEAYRTGCRRDARLKDVWSGHAPR